MNNPFRPIKLIDKLFNDISKFNRRDSMRNQEAGPSITRNRGPSNPNQEYRFDPNKNGYRRI